jgi:hypothetical protein
MGTKKGARRLGRLLFELRPSRHHLFMSLLGGGALALVGIGMVTIGLVHRFHGNALDREDAGLFLLVGGTLIIGGIGVCLAPLRKAGHCIAIRREGLTYRRFGKTHIYPWGLIREFEHTREWIEPDGPEIEVWLLHLHDREKVRLTPDGFRRADFEKGMNLIRQLLGDHARRLGP